MLDRSSASLRPPIFRDDADFQHHVDYIHWNPVKQGLTRHVADWPYSSFHRYVPLGLMTNDWAFQVKENQGDYGEGDS